MARLTAEDWTTAAMDVLLTDGPDAVAIQPLARHLGATKGSFYWHFETRDDLLRAALERWAQESTDAVVAAADALADDPIGRAHGLIRVLADSSAAQPGQLRLLTAADQPDVAAALESATAQRIDYLARQLRAAGLTRAVAQRRATLAYAAGVGLAQLAQATPGVLPAGTRARRAMLDELVDLLADG